MDAINPCPPEWLDNEDNALLRGDAIGDTVYTHRWILKCLFTITEGLPKYTSEENSTKSSSEDAESSKNKNSSQDETEEISQDEFENPEDVGSVSTESDSLSRNEQDSSMKTEKQILELDSEVEDAACQLWDMTVERDVSLHLLNLEEINIFHLAAFIFDESCAPRLTEVMVGVVANLCCIEEGCERILQKKEKNEALLSVLRLLGSTSDVPTLCEVMRLIRLLIWHRVNRTPNTSLASCPLLKLLCLEFYRNAITFLLNNSLSDGLISSLLNLLSNFLYICLPETGVSVASLYSTKEIINGLIEVTERKSSQLQRHSNEEQEKIIHLAVMCIYAFIDTPGERLIQLYAASPDSKLESFLVTYLEHVGRVESPEELIGEVSEHVTRGIGLSQLLIPYMKRSSLIITVGKLLALIHGETHQYSVSRSSSREEEGRKSSLDEAVTYLTAESKRNRRKSKEYKTQFSNPLIEECGWVSPPAIPACAESLTKMSSVEKTNSTSSTPLGDLSEPRNLKEQLNENAFSDKNNENSIDDDDDNLNLSSDLSSLKDLKEVIEDYCYQLLNYWWSSLPAEKFCDKKRRKETQKIILDVLDQCHAHEVLFILKAVRLKDPSLVPKLQEQILDSGSHQRLVTLLAHLYQ